MKKIILLISCVILHINAQNLSQETIEKMKELNTKVGKICMEKLGITEDLVALVHNGKEVVTKEEKCLIACTVNEFDYTFEDGVLRDKLGMSELVKNGSSEYYEQTNLIAAECIAEVAHSADECEYIGQIHNCHLKKAKERNLPALVENL